MSEEDLSKRPASSRCRSKSQGEVARDSSHQKLAMARDPVEESPRRRSTKESSQHGSSLQQVYHARSEEDLSQRCTASRCRSKSREDVGACSYHAKAPVEVGSPKRRSSQHGSSFQQVYPVRCEDDPSERDHISSRSPSLRRSSCLQEAFPKVEPRSTAKGDMERRTSRHGSAASELESGGCASLHCRSSSRQLRGSRIEHVGPEDWERYRKVYLSAMREIPEAFTSSLAEEEAIEEKGWRFRLAHGSALVMTSGGKDVGLTLAYEAPGNVGDAIFGVWVAPGSRGKGFGGRLIDEVVSWARQGNFERVVLKVGDDNTSAIQFYKYKGFVATGVRGTLDPPRENFTWHEQALSLQEPQLRTGSRCADESQKVYSPSKRESRTPSERAPSPPKPKSVKFDLRGPKTTVQSLKWGFDGEGAFVRRMDDGVPEIAGVKVGDRLLTINSKDVRGLSKADIIGHWENAQRGKSRDLCLSLGVM